MEQQQQQQQQQQPKKPKERFQEILLEIFDLIEGQVPEGIYLQVADQLKQANTELNALTLATPQVITLVQEVRQNYYYRHYVQRNRKPPNPRLTEALKAKSDKYQLCSCGRYIHKKKEYIEEHLETQVHYQGIRNKKLSAKKKSTNIEEEITREVVLSAFCLRHQFKREEPPTEPTATASNP